MELNESKIQFLPGVGDKRAQLLKNELNINTKEDLIYFFPYKYIDRTRIYSISEINSQYSYIQIKARIGEMEFIGIGKTKRAVARAYDHTGTVNLVWFHGLRYLKERKFRPDVSFLIFGQPKIFNGEINIIHPEISLYDENDTNLSGFQAIYPSTEKLKRSYISSKTISTLVNNVFNGLKGERLNESFPAWFIKKKRVIYKHDALYNIHFPQSYELLKKAEYRLKFEELFYIQLHILQQRYRRKLFYKGHVFAKVGNYFNTFYFHHLPFPLTDAQKRVIKEIRSDCRSGKQMNRLLQGDVGSGKTIVALLCMLIALDNQYQTCIMAPTEILANQHFESIRGLTADLGINVSLLTGASNTKERRLIHEGLEDGRIQIMIGTHALLEENVCFKNLGLAIIDEQHRFGVAQRSKLWLKNSVPPHILIMTATPIPRTLAMTIYGDLDVSVIDQLPPGRKSVKTVHRYEESRSEVFQFLENELSKGRQAYMVFPMIYESEKVDLQNLEKGFETAESYFTEKGYKVGMVHGKMKNEEKDNEMKEFINHNIDILVSTTVIEVGVNVPNASVMVIEGADRFGLSQLHQLRGRVGRGAEQSYCILMTSYKISGDSRKRIETMTRTDDGFEIAEADLKLRGPGDIEGTQQSGLLCDLKIANLAKDGLILNDASHEANEILKEDPELAHEANEIFNYQLKRKFNLFDNWHQIS